MMKRVMGAGLPLAAALLASTALAQTAAPPQAGALTYQQPPQPIARGELRLLGQQRRRAEHHAVASIAVVPVAVVPVTVASALASIPASCLPPSAGATVAGRR